MLCFELFLVLTIGFIFGSFITSLSWRLVSGVSLFGQERSICPKCKKSALEWLNRYADDLLESGMMECPNCKSRFTGIPGLIEAWQQTAEPVKSTTIRIDTRLRSEVKIRAIKEDMKLKDAVDEALTDWLQKYRTLELKVF